MGCAPSTCPPVAEEHPAKASPPRKVGAPSHGQVDPTTTGGLHPRPPPQGPSQLLGTGTPPPDMDVIRPSPSSTGTSTCWHRSGSIGDGSSAGDVPDLIEFSGDEIRKATGNFSCKIGEGGYGVVYRGSVALNGAKEKVEVAVKVLKQQGRQAFKSWQAEVRFLGDLRHPNLVRLYGYCWDDEAFMLVYEFVPNRSFDYHLFRTRWGQGVLPFSERLRIAIGAGEGVLFLHEGCGQKVVYLDLKAANILLDKHMNVKLADFGLARDGPEGSHLSTSGVVGTLGYLAPEYVAKGHVSEKCDVYSFGVVLIELVTGKRSELDPRLLVWVSTAIGASRDGWREIVDPKMGVPPQGQGGSGAGATWVATEKAVRQTLKAALMCIREDPHYRPSMRTVLETLRVAYRTCTGAPGEESGASTESCASLGSRG